MKPIQPIVWTNHEIEDLTHTIEYTNSHLLAITKAIENLSTLLEKITINVMLFVVMLNVGPWFFCNIKMA